MKRSAPLQRRTPLKAKSESETTKVKDDIQWCLRQFVIQRDGGCILRHYTDIAGECGGYRNDGELILQAEHLHTRANSASYAHPDLVVCLCKRHHIFWKPQHADEYYRLVKQHIGANRMALLERGQADQRPHRYTL